MGTEWRDVRLGDIVDIFDGPHATPLKTTTGPIFLGISNLSAGRVDLSETEHLSEVDFERWTRRVTPTAGDVVFSYETRLGEVGVIPRGLRCCLGRRMGLLRTKEAMLAPEFLVYAYLSPHFQELLRQRTIHGSTVDRIPLVAMPDFPIRVPDLATQRTIAHILGTLDDKIELNRRMNETLEAMARALFKSWFVDFDPVRAKSEGHTPAGMSADTAKLFPSKLVESTLGPIPKGWKVARLSELTNKIGSGATPRGGDKAYILDGTSLIRSQNVYDSAFVWNGLVHIADDEARRLRSVTVDTGDVLLNITGASFLRTCIVDPQVLPARVNQHVAIVRAKEGIPSRYIHNHLLLENTKGYLSGMDAGASRQAITKAHIESVPIIEPLGPILVAWDHIVAPLYGRMNTTARETRNLSILRDSLLPRLLSGELSVANVERVAGAAL